MILYKYLSPENALRVIRSRKLRFTPPSQLNDPFEFRPFYESLNEAPNVQEQLTDQNIREILDEQLGTEFRKAAMDYEKFLPDGFVDRFLDTTASMAKQITPILNDQFTGFIGSTMYENLDRLVGVLCLTEENDNALMWAHYAESHKGVALGFNAEESYFERRINEQDDFRHLERVTYKEQPTVQFATLEDGREILYTKNLDWEYEKEWRMVMPLEKADEVIDAGNFQIHLFEYPPKALRQVIFGCRIPEDFKEQVLSNLNEEHFEHVLKFDAHLDERYRTVHLTEFN